MPSDIINAIAALAGEAKGGTPRRHLADALTIAVERLVETQDTTTLDRIEVALLSDL